MKSAEPKSKYILANELMLHYLERGSDGDQPILLLHGFMGHAHVWDDFADDLMDRYRIFALDQRGHGESHWSWKASYALEDHFLDLTTFVEKLGLENPILVGHSMGGRNALFYAASRPEKVNRLILVDVRAGSSQETSQALKQIIAHLPPKAKSLEEMIRAVQMLFPNLSEKTCKHIARYGSIQRSDGFFVPKYDTRMSLQSEQADYEIEDLWPYLANVSCPALIVRGEGSNFLSREDAWMMCEIMPDAALAEIPGAGHLPMLENPEAFTKAVRRFLSSVYP